MSIEPLAIGVCSWSLQVKSVAELQRLLQRLGIDVVQIACGDPHHAAWEEGDRLPETATTTIITATKRTPTPAMARATLRLNSFLRPTAGTLFPPTPTGSGP